MYDGFKLLHVLAAMVWFGAAVTFNIMLARLSRAGDEPGKKAVIEQATFFGRAVFNPAAIVVVLAGIAMLLTDTSPWGFDDVFVSIGFLGVIASLGIGHGIVNGSAKKLTATIEQDGPGTPAAQALERRIAMFSMIDVAILVIVTYFMVYRPFA